jgi:hypothetical protein
MLSVIIEVPIKYAFDSGCDIYNTKCKSACNKHLLKQLCFHAIINSHYNELSVYRKKVWAEYVACNGHIIHTSKTNLMLHQTSLYKKCIPMLNQVKNMKLCDEMEAQYHTCIHMPSTTYHASRVV